MDAAFLAYIIHIDDIGMHEAGSRLCLHTKLGNKILVFGKFLF